MVKVALSGTIGAQNGHWAQKPEPQKYVLRGYWQTTPRVSSDRGKAVVSGRSEDAGTGQRS